MSNVQAMHNKQINVNDIVAYVVNKTDIKYGIVKTINDDELTIIKISLHNDLMYILSPFPYNSYRTKNTRIINVITNQFINNHTFGILYSTKNNIPLYFNNKKQIEYYLKTELWNIFVSRLHQQYKIKAYDKLFVAYHNPCFEKNLSSFYYVLELLKRSSNIKQEFIDAIEKECIDFLHALDNATLQFTNDQHKIYYLDNFDFEKYFIPKVGDYDSYFGSIIVSNN